jgi:hypothetical protein
MIAQAKRSGLRAVFAPRSGWIGFSLLVRGKRIARLSFGCPQGTVYGRGKRISPILGDFDAARAWVLNNISKSNRKLLAK